MYRFRCLREYIEKLRQLDEIILYLKESRADAQTIVNYESLKLSYIIEKNDFEKSQTPAKKQRSR